MYKISSGICRGGKKEGQNIINVHVTIEVNLMDEDDETGFPGLYNDFLVSSIEIIPMPALGDFRCNPASKVTNVAHSEAAVVRECGR